MAKNQKKHDATLDYKWVKVIPWKGRARMEKRDLHGKVLEIRSC